VRFGARDYDAVVGRWTAKDPILFGVYNGISTVNGLRDLRDDVNKHGTGFGTTHSSSRGRSVPHDRGAISV
jgi:hypothetical protein